MKADLYAAEKLKEGRDHFKSDRQKSRISQLDYSLHRLHLLDVCSRGERLLAARHHHAPDRVVAVAVLERRDLGGNDRVVPKTILQIESPYLAINSPDLR